MSNDRVQAFAKKLWLAMDLARPKVPPEAAAALDTPVASSDARWALALILAIWHLSRVEPDGQSYKQLLIDAEGSNLLAQLNLLSFAMPDPMEQFLKSAQRAKQDYELAGTAVYFQALVQGLGDHRERLYAWLKSPGFSAVGQRLFAKFPAPVVTREQTKTAAIKATPSIGRGEKFDRHDFRARDAGRREAKSAEQLAAAIPDSAKTPTIDADVRASAYLSSLNYSPSDIERILAGPKKA